MSSACPNRYAKRCGRGVIRGSIRPNGDAVRSLAPPIGQLATFFLSKVTLTSLFRKKEAACVYIVLVRSDRLQVAT
jgi:hypothetical protein